MKGIKQSVGEWLSTNFGPGVTKTISENMTAEEYSNYEANATKLQEQFATIEQLKLANETLTKEKETFAIQIAEANATLVKEKEAFTKQLETANETLEKYKELYAIDTNKGKGKPADDSSDRGAVNAEIMARIEALPVGHTDRLALEGWLAKHTQK